MDKEKLIKWLADACVELDGLSSSSSFLDLEEDSIFYTGQRVFAKKLLDNIKNGIFDLKENDNNGKN